MQSNYKFIRYPKSSTLLFLIFVCSCFLSSDSLLFASLSRQQQYQAMLLLRQSQRQNGLRSINGIYNRITKSTKVLSMSTKNDAEDISLTASSMPSSFKSPFLQTLSERGFLHQCTDFATLDETFSSGSPVKAYLGFDATAKSLHVGSLLQIMILRTLQKAGHKPIVLIGGGTTKVGDPSGKDESRQLLTTETIQKNADSLAKVFSKFIKFGDGSTDAIMVNNVDWLDKLNYLEFLRDYGRYFTINRMLSFESVKQRLAREQPLTFLEFNYMLLQAYDFLELHRRYGALLQLGGSDQWGNIVSGVELARKVDQASLFGLTAPLITTSDGKKMGKTASGAIWLNKDLLSEYDYWQFWRNVADADVVRFLKLFTEVPLSEIAEWEKLGGTGSELNAAKIRLADEATRMLHGDACLNDIHETVKSLFSGVGTNLASLEKVPFNLGNDDNATATVVDLMVASGFASSKGEAKRLIKGGGAKVNDVKVSEEGAVVSRKDFDADGHLKLTVGKKKNVVIALTSK